MNHISDHNDKANLKKGLIVFPQCVAAVLHGREDMVAGT